MRASITVESRFRGLQGMGQGGYSAGVLAETIGEAVTVRFHSPVPLDQPLRVARQGDTTTLLHGEVAVLSAQPGSVQDPPPAPIEPNVAARARAWAESRFLEPARSCFSCGSRPDSLRIHAGRASDNRFATPYTPPSWVADGNGEVRLPFVWAPLDCAAGWHVALDQSDPRLAVTGRSSSHNTARSWSARTTWSSPRRTRDGTEGNGEPPPRSTTATGRSAPARHPSGYPFDHCPAVTFGPFQTTSGNVE